MYIEYGHNMDECISYYVPGPRECRHTRGGREYHRQSQCVDDRDPAIMDLQSV